MGYFYYPVIFDYPGVFSKPSVQHERIIEGSTVLEFQLFHSIYYLHIEIFAVYGDNYNHDTGHDFL